MTTSDNCIFCQIVEGTSPSYKVWEDDAHLAFLSIFPNTEGVTVVIPKTHQPSYIFEAGEDVMLALIKASKQVALQLDEKLDDVGRTGMIFEGFGVNHLHAKLFPMHGTKSDEWKQHVSHIDKYFDQYEGYLSSHDYRGVGHDQLSETHKKLVEGN